MVNIAIVVGPSGDVRKELQFAYILWGAPVKGGECACARLDNISSSW